MIPKFYIALFAFIFTSTFTIGQDSSDGPIEPLRYNIGLRFLFDKTFQSEGRRNLKKDLYNILIDTNRFDFVIPVKGQSLESLVFEGRYYSNKKKRGFSVIEMKLIDPDNKTINKVQDKFVLEKNVPLRARALFLELFTGSRDDEEAKIENLEKSVKLLPVVKEALIKNSINGIQKKQKNQVNQIDDIPEDDEEKEGSASKDKKPEIPEKPPKKKRPKKKNSSEISEFENSPDLNLVKEYPKAPILKGVSAKWLTGLKLFVGSESESVYTESIADVRTTTNRLNIGVDGQFGQENSIGFIGVNGSLGLITGEHEYGFGPKFDVSSGYYIAPLGDWIAVGLGVQMNTFNFAGIIERGSGVKKSSHSGLWFGGGVKLNLNRLMQGLNFSGHLYNTLGTSATIGDETELPTTGQKTEIQARVDLYWGVGLAVQLESVNVTASNNKSFLISDESIIISITY